MKLQLTKTYTTLYTDGKTLFMNPDFVNALTVEQMNSLLQHMKLHASLMEATFSAKAEKIAKAYATPAPTGPDYSWRMWDIACSQMEKELDK